MIKLSELLHFADKEKKDGLIPIDDWRYPDVEHLMNMGFEFENDYKLQTPKEPKITIYKKKEPNTDDGEPQNWFYIEEPDGEDNTSSKRFKSFSDVIDYFDGYEQPELYKNM
jgi:hypothetical protein